MPKGDGSGAHAMVDMEDEGVSALDALDVGVLLLDPSGAHRYANDAACEMFGVAREALMGPASLRAQWSALREDETAFREGEDPLGAIASGVSFVIGIRREDRTRWMKVGARARSRGKLVTLTDVTEERARTARATRKYEAVLRAMHEGLVIHARSGEILYANPGAERILGLTQQQLLGIDAADPRWRLIHPDRTPLVPDEVPALRTMRTGEPVRNEIIGVERGDGSRAWLSVSSDNIAGDGNDEDGVVATFTDITSLREAQIAIEQSAARLRAVTDAIPAIIFQYVGALEGSSGDRFRFLAGNLDAMLGGTSRDALLNDPVDRTRFFDAESIAKLETARARSEADLSVIDELIRTHAGRYIRFRAVPERAEGGTLWTGLALDVTDEQRLAESLRHAQRREAMGDLAAGLAHNFNNMLAVILPNIEAARRHVGPAGAPLLEDAANATRRAAELVKQLLLIARGDLHAPCGASDLVHVVPEVARLCRQTLDRRITLDVKLGATSALTRGSANHLQQIVLNLCLNARDALEGAADPRIELRLEPDGPAHYLLTVHDNGVGMTAETQRHMGEPFFTTKAPGVGTGLGLATVYSTMRDIGGSVSVRSAPGLGTTFSLRFPKA